mmetsp:Transcript_23086/g.46748  ORF Transcript_23086/g.46748 Transcript_23086/m.46748 type:complete len:282 (-) Transcript_23086:1187-2032(-)
MISVPQVIAITAGACVALGAAGTWLILSATKASSGSRTKFDQVTAGKKHFAPRNSKELQEAAKKIRWYSPKFSPKNVPFFYDVSSFSEDPKLFQYVIDVFAAYYKSFPPSKRPTAIVGCDARGFILGPPVALALDIPFVLLRKDGKSPGILVEGTGYTKEYAEKSLDKMCLRLGSVKPGDRAVIIDDLLATGGTAIAGMQLVQAMGATVHSFATIIALEGLNGMEKCWEASGGAYKDVPIFTMFTSATIGNGCPSDPPVWEGGRMVPLADAVAVQAKYKLW